MIESTKGFEFHPILGIPLPTCTLALELINIYHENNVTTKQFGKQIDFVFCLDKSLCFTFGTVRRTFILKADAGSTIFISVTSTPLQ